MADFYTEVIKTSPSFGSTERVSDIELLEPVTRVKVLAILSDLKSHGHPSVAYETYRSQARQEQLFQQGATQLQHVGVHGYGLACDIVPLNSAGDPTWDDPAAFALIGHLAHAYGIITGQDWGFPHLHHSFIDQPHIQRCAVRDQGKLFAGIWYPAQSYDPYSPGG